jgi:VWFA-related protein
MGVALRRDFLVSSTLKAFAAAVLSLTFTSAFASPDEQSPVVRETAEVTLVEVPVNVIRRDGKPVAGLGPADFELEDDGVRQTITSVDVVDLARKRELPSSPEDFPAAARRHFLLLFDLSFSTATEIVRAREAAMRFVQAGMAPPDLAAVASTAIGQGVRLHVTFTADRLQLAAAIRRVGLPHTEERGADPLAFAVVAPGDPFLTTDAQGERVQTGGLSLIDPGSTRVYTVMARKSADSYSETRVEQHLSEMGSLASALNAVEGRKTIIFFSEGFDGRLLVGSIARERSHEETMTDNDAILDGRFWALDLDRRAANTPLQRQLDATLTLFRRSDCVVYPIDIGGLKADGDVAVGLPSRRGEEALFAFANGTGGELLRNANDLGEQMSRIAEKTGLTYVLTFRPTNVGGEGKFHALKVRVNVKGARVSARAGYYESRIFRMLTPLERALTAADVITHEKRQADFPLAVLALALNEQPISRVPVLLEVPGRDLLPKEAAERLTVGLYVYAVDDHGRLADFFSRSVAVDLARDGPRLREGAFRYYGTLRLAPGSYRIRSFVRDEDRGRFAFQVVSLDVPEPAVRALRAMPPLFFAADGPGISLKDPSKPEGAGREPFELAGNAFVPQLRPRIVSGKSARLCLLLYAASADPNDPLLRLEARVRDAHGRLSSPAQFSVIGRTAPDASGLTKLLVEFAPQGLPPGDYSLSVTFRDSRVSGPPAVTEAPFQIL